MNTICKRAKVLGTTRTLYFSESRAMCHSNLLEQLCISYRELYVSSSPAVDIAVRSRTPNCMHHTHSIQPT